MKLHAASSDRASGVLRVALVVAIVLVAGDLTDAMLLGHFSALETLTAQLGWVWIVAMKQSFTRLPRHQVVLAAGALSGSMLLTLWVTQQDPDLLFLCGVFLPLILTGGFCRAWTRKGYIHPPCAASLWALWL